MYPWLCIYFTPLVLATSVAVLLLYVRGPPSPAVSSGAPSPSFAHRRSSCRELLYGLAHLLGWSFDVQVAPRALGTSSIPPATTMFFELHDHSEEVCRVTWPFLASCEGFLQEIRCPSEVGCWTMKSNGFAGGWSGVVGQPPFEETSRVSCKCFSPPHFHDRSKVSASSRWDHFNAGLEVCITQSGGMWYVLRCSSAVRYEKRLEKGPKWGRSGAEVGLKRGSLLVAACQSVVYADSATIPLCTWRY